MIVDFFEYLLLIKMKALIYFLIECYKMMNSREDMEKHHARHDFTVSRQSCESNSGKGAQ